MNRCAALLFGFIAAGGGTSGGPLPSIAAKLPSDIRNAEREFDRRVKAALPIGTLENDAVSTLEADGFTIVSVGPDGMRSFKRSDGICQSLWSVRWRADAGTLRDVFGVYGFRCP